MLLEVLYMYMYTTSFTGVYVQYEQGGHSYLLPAPRSHVRESCTGERLVVETDAIGQHVLKLSRCYYMHNSDCVYNFYVQRNLYFCCVSSNLLPL